MRMDCLPSANSEPVSSVKREVDDEVDADERLDHVPLMKRMKTLLLARGLSTSSYGSRIDFSWISSFCIFSSCDEFVAVDMKMIV